MTADQQQLVEDNVYLVRGTIVRQSVVDHLVDERLRAIIEDNIRDDGDREYIDWPEVWKEVDNDI